MDRQDSQEGLRVTLAEMEKVPLAKDPNVIFNIFVSQALGLGSRREGRPNNKEVISGFPATSVSLHFVPLFEAFEACDLV